jgi:hypothetical protein
MPSVQMGCGMRQRLEVRHRVCPARAGDLLHRLQIPLPVPGRAGHRDHGCGVRQCASTSQCWHTHAWRKTRQCPKFSQAVADLLAGSADQRLLEKIIATLPCRPLSAQCLAGMQRSRRSALSAQNEPPRPWGSLSAARAAGDGRVAPLFKHVFPPAAAPSLALIGLLWKSIRNTQFELQARRPSLAAVPATPRSASASVGRCADRGELAGPLLFSIHARCSAGRTGMRSARAGVWRMSTPAIVAANRGVVASVCQQASRPGAQPSSEQTLLAATARASPACTALGGE